MQQRSTPTLPDRNQAPVRPQPAPTRRVRLLRGLGFGLCLLLLLEGLTRFSLLLLDKTWEPVVPPGVFRFDPLLGWSPRPDTCAVSRRTGHKVQYCINSLGLRGPETTYEKPLGRFRIVLLGDSRSFGYGVPVEQHFSQLLEGYFQNLEVINLGVDGYGVDQSLLRLRQEGLRFEPDLVLAYVAHYRNERHMKTKIWGAGKPRFVLEDGELVLENQPVQNTPATHLRFLELDRNLGRWCKLYAVLRDAGVHMHAQYRRAMRANSHEPTTTPGEPGTDLAHHEEQVNLVAEAIVLEMAAASREQGVPFLCVTAIERLYRRLHQEGVPVLNISPALGSSGFPLPENLGHFNAAGNGAFAWELQRYLSHNGLVPRQFFSDRHDFNHPDRTRYTGPEDQKLGSDEPA